MTQIQIAALLAPVLVVVGALFVLAVSRLQEAHEDRRQARKRGATPRS